MQETYLTAVEAAERLRVGRMTILRLIKTGQLKGSKIGTGKTAGWRIAATEVERLLGEQGTSAEAHAPEAPAVVWDYLLTRKNGHGPAETHEHRLHEQSITCLRGEAVAWWVAASNGEVRASRWVGAYRCPDGELRPFSAAVVDQTFTLKLWDIAEGPTRSVAAARLSLDDLSWLLDVWLPDTLAAPASAMVCAV